MQFYLESGIKIYWIIEIQIEAFTPYLFYMKIPSLVNNILNQMLGNGPIYDYLHLIFIIFVYLLGEFFLFRLNSFVILKYLLTHINYLILFSSQWNNSLFFQISERTPRPVHRRAVNASSIEPRIWTQHPKEWIELRVEKDDQNKHGIQRKIVFWDLDLAVSHKCVCAGKLCCQCYEKLFVKKRYFPAVNS